jgi:hypothetical protein
MLEPMDSELKDENPLKKAPDEETAISDIMDKGTIISMRGSVPGI